MKTKDEVVVIAAPKFEMLRCNIQGTAPYMQCRFSQKALAKMKEKHEAGSTARKGTKREARDFEEDFINAQHISETGWHGIPVPAFRNAMIDACRMVGFRMTHARMSVFVLHDGLDKVDGTPLVRLNAPAPERCEMVTRNATGVVDIRVRPMWREWMASLVIRFDSDQFRPQDVLNLLARAGEQVGIGEGRPFSKDSNGLGFGTFEICV